MKSKKFYRPVVIDETKEHIHRLFPNATNIDVKIKKDELGHFQSQIMVRVPNHKELVAHKKDPLLKKSLDKTFQAIVSQISKIKNKSKQRKDVMEELILMSA